MLAQRTPLSNPLATNYNGQAVALKVCGMKHAKNMEDVALLSPHYMGFIFWEPSKRYFNTSLGNITEGIIKTGVFVDASVANIIDVVNTYQLGAIQLHGKESPEFCKDIKNALVASSEENKDIQLIKVFSIKDDFDFKQLSPFEEVCDFFLFDTKGKLPGGNGYTFSWEVLKDYPSTKPYFLSGGIGLEEVTKIKTFLQQPESTYCYAIDVNSKFEMEPGLKNSTAIQEFIAAF